MIHLLLTYQLIFLLSEYNILLSKQNVTVLYHEVEIHLELGTSTLITEGETICFSSMSLNSNRPTYSRLKIKKCVIHKCERGRDNKINVL